MSSLARKSLSAGLLAFSFGVFARQGRADEIELVKGDSRIDVQVVDETYETVAFKMKGVPQPQMLPAAKVKSVTYAKQSNEYGIAETAMAEHRYENAVPLFITAAGAAKGTSSWEKQYGLFNAAECLRGLRKFDDAIKAYQNLLTQVPKTKFFGTCFERTADCYRAKGSLAEAKQTYEKLKGEVTLKNLGPRIELLADFRLVELSERENPKAALESYVTLQDKATEYPDVANMARLRVGYVLIQQGQVEKARQYFSDIIKDRQASDVATVAGAYNGFGSTFVTKKDPTPDDFNKALFPFFRTVFHYGDQLAGTDMLAEALYWGGRCLEARTGESNVKRARQLYDRCTKEFPTSDWAKKSAERK